MPPRNDNGPEIGKNNLEEELFGKGVGGKNMKSISTGSSKSRTDFIFELYEGKKLGEWIVIAVSVICVLMMLPFVNWIKIANIDTLYQTLGVSAENMALLKDGYPMYLILSFVQYSGAGSIGLFSMTMTIIMAATAYFQISFLIKLLKNKGGKKGRLEIYGAAEAAMVFLIIATAASVIYTIFANLKFGMPGFRLSPAVYLLLIISVIGFGILKRMQKAERALYHEHGLWGELKKNWILFLMLVPTFLYFLINNYLPMVGVYYAFTNFNFHDGLWASPFVGMKNFEFLFKADLWRLTRNTVLYNIVFIALGNVLQIFFAILVSQVSVKWFKKTSQTLMFMPYFVSFVILKVIVYNLFEYQYGVVNSMITSLGGDRIDFYNTPSYWPFLITIFHIWKGIGYGMVVYLATIMGIDSELYDAAKVDGANIFQQIWYITLPLLKPTFIILLLYALGGIMKGQFELFYQMVGNNGVLFNITDIIDTYVYRIAMTQPLNMGLGTAAGLYQSVFGFVLVVTVNWLVKKKNDEYALF